MIPTRGSSDIARFVAEQTELGRRHLRSSYSVGLGEAFNELCEVAEDSACPNWDGYGAEPVSNDVYGFAYRFLEALPLGTPAPSVGAEPDGQLTLEWYKAPRRTLSVSVSGEGDLHYAALIGLSKAYGTEPFLGDVPSTITALIKRLSAG